MSTTQRKSFWGRWGRPKVEEPEPVAQQALPQSTPVVILEPVRNEDIALQRLELGDADKPAHSATVECVFRNRESTWGKVANEGAAVLIMHVTLVQPAGYKLRDATLNLYLLADESPPLVDCPAATDIAPKGVYGLATESKVNRAWQVQPEIGVGDIVTLGGVGYNNAKEYLEKHCWLFQTARQSGSGRRLTNARFVWQANPDNNQNEQCGPLMVALGISHLEKPFLIGFDIAGKLKEGLHTYRYSGKALTRLEPKASTEDITELMLLERLEAKTKAFNSS